jgi:hypothetical protein
MSRFSERRGYAAGDVEIVVREDAPHEFRGVLVDIAYEAGEDPQSLRSVVSGLLRVREDPNNWSALTNVDSEVRGLVDNCPWYEVYDIVEAIYEGAAATQSSRCQPIRVGCRVWLDCRSHVL